MARTSSSVVQMENFGLSLQVTSISKPTWSRQCLHRPSLFEYSRLRLYFHLRSSSIPCLWVYCYQSCPGSTIHWGKATILRPSVHFWTRRRTSFQSRRTHKCPFRLFRHSSTGPSRHLCFGKSWHLRHVCVHSPSNRYTHRLRSRSVFRCRACCYLSIDPCMCLWPLLIHTWCKYRLHRCRDESAVTQCPVLSFSSPDEYCHFWDAGILGSHGFSTR